MLLYRRPCLWTRILYGSVAKWSLQNSAKLAKKKFTVRPKGGGERSHHRPPPLKYATVYAHTVSGIQRRILGYPETTRVPVTLAVFGWRSLQKVQGHNAKEPETMWTWLHPQVALCDIRIGNLVALCDTQTAIEKSCRLIRLIWSPLLPFVYSIVSIDLNLRSFIALRLLRARSECSIFRLRAFRSQCGSH